MEIKKNVWALLPIFIFLILYLGLGILFEYVLKISMGFYSSKKPQLQILQSLYKLNSIISVIIFQKLIHH